MNHESSLINITGTTAIMLPFNLGLEHSGGVSQFCCLLSRSVHLLSCCCLGEFLLFQKNLGTSEMEDRYLDDSITESKNNSILLSLKRYLDCLVYCKTQG